MENPAGANALDPPVTTEPQRLIQLVSFKRISAEKQRVNIASPIRQMIARSSRRRSIHWKLLKMVLMLEETPGMIAPARLPLTETGHQRILDEVLSPSVSFQTCNFRTKFLIRVIVSPLPSDG